MEIKLDGGEYAAGKYSGLARVTGDEETAQRIAMHNQINVISRATLEEAMTQPECRGEARRQEYLALRQFLKLAEASDERSMDLESGVDDAVAVDIGVANYQIAARNG